MTLTERKAEVIGYLKEYIDLVDKGDWNTLATCSDMGDIPELIMDLAMENLQ